MSAKTNFGKIKSKKISQESSMEKALSLYENGDMRNAKKFFEKIIIKEPSNPDAYFHLGIIAKNQKKYAEAIKHYEKVISIDSNYVNAFFNLGGIFIDLEQYDTAHTCFSKVIALIPAYTNAWYNLGIVATGQKNFNKAIEYYEKVIALEPEFANAYFNIGCIFMTLKNNDDALTYLQKTVSLNPNFPEAFFNMACTFTNKQDDNQAIFYYEKVLQLNPAYHLAYNNLGVIYHYQHNFDKAIECFEKAIAIFPDAADSYMNMGNTFRGMGNTQKAIECYKKSLSLQPSLLGLNNLCGYFKELQNYDEAFDLSLKMLSYPDLKKHDLAFIHDTFIQLCEWKMAERVIDQFKKAEVVPEYKDVLAGSLMEFCATTDLTLDEIAESHKLWGSITEGKADPFDHAPRMDGYRGRKKIRIAYSSPDLREHSVGYLIKDIIASHDRANFEIFCYANHDPKDSDSFTNEIQQYCDSFKFVKHLTDQALAQEIYSDEIHILIDLAGHTAGHRLRAFAYKPAPIQVTYLGYPNTTGLSRMNYRITDRFAETSADFDYRYSEKLIRLTNSFLSFKGFSGVFPPNQKKAPNPGEIIFGCFNNIQKLNPRVIFLWSQILKAVESSRLFLKAKQLNTKIVWDNIVNEFEKYGIPETRLQCLGYTNTREEHLACYNDIDIALDTFPYHGTVTTLEALWMNVPLITLVGESHAQRVGYSILNNLALEELIAFSEDDYVKKAITLAHNPEKIQALKKVIRKSFLASPLCNPKVITKELELNFKKIWLDYTAAETDSEKATMQTGFYTGFDSAISESSRLRMAMVKVKNAEFEQAIAYCENLLSSREFSPLAWYLLGISFHGLGQTKKAIDALETSLRLRSDNVGALKLLGEMYCRENDIGSADACLEKLAALHKRLPRQEAYFSG